jgi:hypothetical protein
MLVINYTSIFYLFSESSVFNWWNAMVQNSTSGEQKHRFKRCR